MNFFKLNKTMDRKQKQSGQTLIETVVGIFVLVTGISSALGLAIYSFNASRNINKQIIASGLAREGIEAVKNMRDTNWLKGPLALNGCYDYSTGVGAAASCHKDWQGSSTNSTLYCLNPSTNNATNSSPIGCNGSGGASASYILDFSPTAANPWLMYQESTNFGLAINKDFPNNSRRYYYSIGSDGNAISCTNPTNLVPNTAMSDFCRQIVINEVTNVPYNQDEGPKLQILSRVWWVDKNCPRSATFPTNGKCAIQLEMDLTNWKDY